MVGEAFGHQFASSNSIFLVTSIFLVGLFFITKQKIHGFLHLLITLLLAIVTNLYLINPMVLTYLGFDFGFAHIELKIKAGQLFIVEVNPRLAGGMIPILIEESTGINLLKSLIKLYTGQLAEEQITYKKFAAIRHLIPSKSGKIMQLIYKDQSSGTKAVFVKHVGDTIVLHGDYRDRAGYIITSDTNQKHCNDKMSQALKHFNIEMMD